MVRHRRSWSFHPLTTIHQLGKLLSFGKIFEFHFFPHFLNFTTIPFFAFPANMTWHNLCFAMLIRVFFPVGLEISMTWREVYGQYKNGLNTYYATPMGISLRTKPFVSISSNPMGKGDVAIDTTDRQTKRYEGRVEGIVGGVNSIWLKFRSCRGPTKMREKFSKVLDGQHPTSGHDQQVCEDETRCGGHILYIRRNTYTCWVEH